jgi:hypothetical protein
MDEPAFLSEAKTQTDEPALLSEAKTQQTFFDIRIPAQTRSHARSVPAVRLL